MYRVRTAAHAKGESITDLVSSLLEACYGHIPLTDGEENVTYQTSMQAAYEGRRLATPFRVCLVLSTGCGTLISGELS